ncbi:MAG TPA: hemerythrin domain-containing protein [Ferruginibacter sp.]|nr:hemerythrin domain-containing protein [Ferruginibacter sp.]HMZ99610.1 hemerythrin domain-containing protein [Ferruginibacter sp.]HNA15964.1 hemerythrin domain-containing protein [Ferruginibacter sp.]HNF00839.1 hemerythrin domain-containing protein [Ferruginibacter sp.]HNF42253.1 hemerythrin domain-containing protein [Ferruginibacter sp.]
MKRSETLAPLSRDHHRSLILAQLLKKNAPAYKGLPETTSGKAEYALQQFRQDIAGHFEKEEQVLETLGGLHPQIDELAGQIKEEHALLHKLFSGLEAMEQPEEDLDALGRLLEQHIRTEERVLFPLLEQHCSETLKEQVHALLH